MADIFFELFDTLCDALQMSGRPNRIGFYAGQFADFLRQVIEKTCNHGFQNTVKKRGRTICALT